MQRITKFLSKSKECGIFHDSRKDSRLFAAMINFCFSKINELQEEVEKLQEIIKNNIDKQ